ncbi:unnamed protein product [Linum tenue]|uniref:BTB/POZ domain-containing protein DOT3 n=1 Tax=Linum tenue TaxID=586396 RepID=A0AAV0KHJ2_9ROSI|nr:unnamed protein product [Linum tenue]
MADYSATRGGRRVQQLYPHQQAFFTITTTNNTQHSSLPLVQSQSSSSASGSTSEDDDQQLHHQQSIMVPSNGIAAALTEVMDNKDQTWSITPQTPPDLSVQVQEATFTVHKYPLVSKCGYIGRLELQPSISNFAYEVKLENFPGGPEAFDTVLKFCYGLPLDLNPQNIAQLRCASEYLEMSEDLDDGNLITKTEAFLTFIIISSWRDTITVLKSCEALSPWVEDQQIVRRCCDSIAWKASRDPATASEDAWWLDDVATLRIDHFTRVITAIRAKVANPEIIGKCIMRYASRWLSGMDEELEVRGYANQGKRKEDQGAGHDKEKKAIIENLISILPPKRETVPCRFLLKMLKMGIVYCASPALITQLEKRVGMTLETATVNDLLIPNYKNEDQGKLLKCSDQQHTMHNLDVVQRIIEYFLMHEQDQQQLQPTPEKSSVSKLLDSYLAEIAKDPNVSVTKFQVLAEALPENARACHDGLYRAIDTYIKAHPSLSEHDRKRVCKLLICEKLSLDASMHAAQNERLPLRTAIQVLFSEQVKLRASMQRKESAESSNISEQETHQTETKSEIMTLKAELGNVKTQMTELQKDYLELQLDYARLSNKQKQTLSWSFGWKRIRRSSLFHRKADGEEVEGRQRSHSTSGKPSLRRRMSIS